MRYWLVSCAIWGITCIPLASLAQSELVPDAELWESRWDRRWDEAWADPAPDVSLDLRAGHRRTDQLVDTYAFATLRLPWQALLRLGRSQRQLTAPPQGDALPERTSPATTASPAKTARPRPNAAFATNAAAATNAKTEASESSAAKESTDESPGDAASPDDLQETASPRPTASPRQTEPSRGMQVERDAKMPPDAPGSETAAQLGGPPEHRGALSDDGWPDELPFPKQLPLELVRRVLRRSIEASGVDRGMARLQRLAKRARLSGLTPELRLRGVHGFDSTLSQEAVGIYPGEVSTRDSSDSLLEVRLTFRLDRVLFDSAESTLARARDGLTERRGEVMEQALEYLLAWFEAERDCRRDDLLPEEQAEAMVLAERARLKLFVATDGWFTGLTTLRPFLLAAGQDPAAERALDD